VQTANKKLVHAFNTILPIRIRFPPQIQDAGHSNKPIIS